MLPLDREGSIQGHRHQDQGHIRKNEKFTFYLLWFQHINFTKKLMREQYIVILISKNKIINRSILDSNLFLIHNNYFSLEFFRF